MVKSPSRLLLNQFSSGTGLIEAIRKLHEEDRVFYWRLVYQEKRFNAELVRELNYLMEKQGGSGQD